MQLTTSGQAGVTVGPCCVICGTYNAAAAVSQRMESVARRLRRVLINSVSPNSLFKLYPNELRQSEQSSQIMA